MQQGKAETTDLTGALSADIRFLGNLLGQVIREQHGTDAFDLVERVRADAKARRSSDNPAATATLAALIDELDLEQRRILIKAFSNYFQLINIAEDEQRIRVLRKREADGLLIESIEYAIGELARAGFTAEQMRALINRLSVNLVMTAHPSEAKRKEVLIKLRHIAEMLSVRDRGLLLPREQRTLESTLVEEIEELWQTRPTRASRATVADEVDFGLYFITSVIMDVVLSIYDDLQHALETHFPGEDWSDLPMFLHYASWIGGDRDGNPNVTADVTLQTLKTLRQAARQVYLQEIAFLREHLTQSIDEVPVSAELLERVQPSQFPERLHDEVYRQMMAQIWVRLNSDAYVTSGELLDDLLLIDRSLRQNRGSYVANGTLRRLIQKVRLFGLHLVPLDIREDARLHRAALDELLRHYGQAENYLEMAEADRQALLTSEITNPRPLFPSDPDFSETTNRVIATWRMIAKAHKQYGKDVITTVIASMSTAPSDILSMLLMAREVGVDADIDVVPLFETIDDLEAAPQIMTTLFANEQYRKHLEVRGHRQQIMLGYSDSNKDGGYIASNWNLYVAQQKLAEVCVDHQIELELFHGRGGSIGRGGGPANRAILSHPPAAMQGRLRITEQGEVIAYRYSNTEIARRHLNQMIHAVLMAVGAPSLVVVRPEWRATMDTLSKAGQDAYRTFVYETPGFLDYWQQATPINELARMPIGSRPARRRQGGFETVRAIPWMFSWMQSRAIIPSWYGVGTALEQFCDGNPDNLALLRTMYREWLFFTALIENVQLDLAKADMGIAELYASLVDVLGLRELILSQMRTEHERARRLICMITEQHDLLDATPVLKRSIERRNPYVDPLNFIQVALLRELRAVPPGTDMHERLLSAVLSTINGIAAGMKTTG